MTIRLPRTITFTGNAGQSNSAGKIADLRKQVMSAKGKIKRRKRTIEELQQDVSDLQRLVRIKQDEILSMGGTVKR